MASNKQKLLFLVTEDWYFCTHRLALAVAAQAAGYEVVVATSVGECAPMIEGAGLRLIRLQQLKRSSLNPFRELRALLELIAIYRRERPDLVHQVALKPVIYGSLAARLTGVRCIVNALGGLGFVFTSKRWQATVLRHFLVRLFRFILNHSGGRLIVQNKEDRQLLTERAIIKPAYIRLIRGAGVDLADYLVHPLGDGIPLIVLASRMLWDKGVGEFVAAAGILKKQGIAARFALVGDTDTETPTAIPRSQLTAWHEQGVIEWWGYRKDMPQILAQAHVVCLPTFYGEGVPKVLLEAMSCGRPIITTDMPGCRELIVAGENGVLIPPRDAASLARAMALLVQDQALCQRMGIAGRKIAEAEYALEKIVAETFAVYDELIHPESHGLN